MRCPAWLGRGLSAAWDQPPAPHPTAVYRRVPPSLSSPLPGLAAARKTVDAAHVKQRLQIDAGPRHVPRHPCPHLPPRTLWAPQHRWGSVCPRVLPSQEPRVLPPNCRASPTPAPTLAHTPTPFIKRRGDSTFRWTLPAGHSPRQPGPRAAVQSHRPGRPRGPFYICTAAGWLGGPSKSLCGSQVPRAGVAVVVEFLLHVHHVPGGLLKGPVRPPAQLPQAAQLGQPGPRAICRGTGAVRRLGPARTVAFPGGGHEALTVAPSALQARTAQCRTPSIHTRNQLMQKPSSSPSMRSISCLVTLSVTK